MVKEQSYGIIPMRKSDAGWEVLVVKHRSGHWSFPKGHPETIETPLETASRELKEETSLDVIKVLSEDLLEEKYVYRFKGELRDKTVTYFIAEVNGQLKIDTHELDEARWAPVNQAANLVTFSQARAICHNIQNRFA